MSKNKENDYTQANEEALLHDKSTIKRKCEHIHKHREDQRDYTCILYSVLHKQLLLQQKTIKVLS